MYLLSCPNCQAELSITPAQAGDSVPCPECRQIVAVPKLGELRKLPQSAESPTRDARGSRSAGGNIAFVALSLIALAALLGTGYNAIRWAMVDAPDTTEIHLYQLRKIYDDLDPASLVREFEDMEKTSVDLLLPYKYRLKVIEKSKWGWNTAIAGGLTLLFGAGALIAASRSRRD